MKLAIDASALLKGLRPAGQVARATPRSTIPNIAHIVLETRADRLCARINNLRLGADIALAEEGGLSTAAIAEPGKVAVPTRLLLDILTTYGDDRVVIESMPRMSGLRITGQGGGCREAVIYGCAPEDVAAMPDDKGAVVVATLAPADLKTALLRVAPYAATDDMRPVLTAVQMRTDPAEGMRLVAADGFRLAHLRVANAEIAIPPPHAAAQTELLIPREMTAALKVLLSGNDPVTISRAAKTNVMWVEHGPWRLFCSTIEGSYPDVDKIMGDNFATIVARFDVDGPTLYQAVRASGLVARDGAGIIRLVMEDGAVRVSSAAVEVATMTETIPCTITQGAGGKVAINHRYFEEFLRLAPGPVTIGIATPSSPVALGLAENDAYQVVIMPMFVQW